jgi:hypothetical protein
MIQEIIKTTDEISRILTLAGSFDLEEFKPSLRQGVRFVARYTGPDVINKALTHYNSDDYTDVFTEDESKEGKEELDKLVMLIQQSAVVWGFFKYAPIGNVIVNSSGIQVTWNDRMRPANDWQLDRMGDALKELAFENIDELLSFLFENSEKLEVESVKALLKIKDLFINSAAEFNNWYDIGFSNRFFYELMPIIRDIENRFLKPILKDRFESLKASKDSPDLSEVDKQILDAVYPPLAKMSIYEASIRLKRELFVDSLYNKVTSTSERNASSPSDLYNQATSEFKFIENLIKKIDNPIPSSNDRKLKSQTRKSFRL